MAFLLFDTARSERVPEILLSGDFLFVGSLGRPDLIGDDVKLRLAGLQYDSVQKLRSLPDGLEIHPGHGAGSMCGAGLSARPMSTLGFERIANPYLRAGLYARGVRRARSSGTSPLSPAVLPADEGLNAGSRCADQLPACAEHPGSGQATSTTSSTAGPVVIDLREPVAFGGGTHARLLRHRRWNGTRRTWAAWVVPHDTPILLVALADASDIRPAVRSLARVGLDDVRGYLEGGIERWIAEGLRDAHATGRRRGADGRSAAGLA